MLSAVSGVSFRGTENADFQRLVESEGKFANPAGTGAAQQPAADTVDLSTKVEEPKKKGGKAGKIIGGLVAAVIIGGLALFGLKRGDVLKINPEATSIVEKATSKLAEAGEWIGTKMIDPLMNLFKKKGADVAEDIADAATNAAK